MDDELKRLLESNFGITFRNETIAPGVTADVPYYQGRSLLQVVGTDAAASREATERNVINVVLDQLAVDLQAGNTSDLDAVLDMIASKLPSDKQAQFTTRFDALQQTLRDHPEAADEFIGFLSSNSDRLLTQLESPNDFGLNSFFTDVDAAVQTGVTAGTGGGASPSVSGGGAGGGTATPTIDTPAGYAIASQIVGEITHMGFVNPQIRDGHVDWNHAAGMYGHHLCGGFPVIQHFLTDVMWQNLEGVKDYIAANGPIDDATLAS